MPPKDKVEKLYTDPEDTYATIEGVHERIDLLFGFTNLEGYASRDGNLLIAHGIGCLAEAVLEVAKAIRSK